MMNEKHIFKGQGVTIIPVLNKTKGLITDYNKVCSKPHIKPHYLIGIIPKNDLITIPYLPLDVLDFAENYPRKTKFFTIILKPKKNY